MKLHHFYVGTELELQHDFWLHDVEIIQRWNQALHYQAGQQVVLFDGVQTQRLYRIVVLKEDEAHLELVTDYEPTVPSKNVFLFWALLPGDANDRVLQEATELGISHFVPLLSGNSTNTAFDVEHARETIIKAVEQSGRTDIPSIREPMLVKTALEHMAGTIPLLVCDQGDERPDVLDAETYGVLVGPEAGWTDQELGDFADSQLPHLGLGASALFAESAVHTAATILNIQA